MNRFGVATPELMKFDGSERVPTELSSARLLRATKSQLDLSCIDGELSRDTERLGGAKSESDFVTVRL